MRQIVFVYFLLASVSCGAQSTGEPGLKVVNTTESLDRLAREPMLAQHPDGSLFVTGYTNDSESPGLWKSTDLGKTWKRVNVGTAANGAKGNSDKDLVIDSEGNIYLVSMEFTRIDAPDSAKVWEGKFIALGISRDVGETWDWQYLSETLGDDRPWIAAAGGVVYVSWNNREGVFFRKSEDQGMSWSPVKNIHEKGCSSHMAVTPSGKIAIRITPMYQSGYLFDQEANFMAISSDKGESWDLKMAPGDAKWNDEFVSPDGIPRWVEPVAWTSDEKLVHFWSEGKVLKLGISTNNGNSWQIHDFQNESNVYFPMIFANGNELIASWMSQTERPAPLNGHVAHITLTNEKPSIIYSEPLAMDIWSRGDAEERDTGGEYFPAIFLNDGSIGAITTIQVFADDRFGFKWWHLTANAR